VAGEAVPAEAVVEALAVVEAAGVVEAEGVAAAAAVAEAAVAEVIARGERPGSSAPRSERESRIPCSGFKRLTPLREIPPLSSQFSCAQGRASSVRRGVYAPRCSTIRAASSPKASCELGAAGDALFGGLGPEAVAEFFGQNVSGSTRTRYRRPQSQDYPATQVCKAMLGGEPGPSSPPPASRLRPEAGKGTGFAPSAKPLAPPIR
jgi:hypothetical protein